MKFWILVLAGVMWALLGAAQLSAQVPPGPGAVPNDLAIEQKWYTLVLRLGSESFAEREAAQKELAGAGWKDLPVLEKLLAGADDLEVRERLGRGVTAIKERMAWDPPPIALELNRASAGALAQKLEAVIGKPVRVANGADSSGGDYTLQAEEQPFWEVMTQLSRQHGFLLRNDRQYTLAQGPPGMAGAKVFGPLMVQPREITRTVKLNLAEMPGAEMAGERTLRLHAVCELDPRVVVVRCQSPVITEIRDETGKVLYEAKAADNWSTPYSPVMFDFDSDLKLPPDVEPRKVTIKGEVNIEAMLEEDTVLIADMSKRLNEDIAVGSQLVKFLDFGIDGSIVHLNFNTRPSSGPPNVDLLRVAIVDATGKRVWTDCTMGGIGGGIVVEMGAVPPLKVELKVSTKTVKKKLEFELKDLPLPAM